ncbi:MAG: ATP-binding cassette domain-containing protein [Acidobacteriota bacterium]|nr:ATP-binding cassette domain-containing protein [Acidobacteriota bacterium]
MAIVQLDRIRKVYDTKVAVEGLSLTVEAGTMFGLLGPNGSGKTSSIRMMIGITMPDSGSVSLFGKPFVRSHLGRVGYLPEERGLYKKMKVLDQLVFLGRLHYLGAALAEQRARDWCEKLQIADTLHKKTEDLSKGMQQKVQFIGALLHDPDLIIMDEPFSGLDPVNANMLMDTLLELRSRGKAVLFSTHRMDQVEKLCDNIALIHRGKLVLYGSMHDIKSRYPHNRIHIKFEGDDSFLHHPCVECVHRFPGQADVRLRPSATLADDAQALLARALQHARVTHFAVTEPTLEEIFIEKVQEISPGADPIEPALEEIEEPVGSYLDA